MNTVDSSKGIVARAKTGSHFCAPAELTAHGGVEAEGLPRRVGDCAGLQTAERFGGKAGLLGNLGSVSPAASRAFFNSAMHTWSVEKNGAAGVRSTSTGGPSNPSSRSDLACALSFSNRSRCSGVRQFGAIRCDAFDLVGSLDIVTLSLRGDGGLVASR